MRKYFAIIGILLFPFISHAQVIKYKAVFTMNFIRYIGWPEETKQGDFVIGIIRDSKMADQMRKHSEGKKFGFQDVKIVEFNSPGSYNFV